MYTWKCYLNRGKNQKDQIILLLGRGILADFWVPHDIESCNFQNLFVFRFPETSQNLVSFRQLLFSLFQRGDPKPQKSTKNTPNRGQLWSGPSVKCLVKMQMRLRKGLDPIVFGLLARAGGACCPSSNQSLKSSFWTSSVREQSPVKICLIDRLRSVRSK